MARHGGAPHWRAIWSGRSACDGLARRPATDWAPACSSLQPGYDRAVPGSLLYRAGVRGWHLHLPSLVCVVYCLGLWIRAKTVDQSHRGHAERRALYVGMWPSTLWVIGDAIERYKR